jgi:glucose-1-phosphate adenylyltransferase
MSVLAMILAGGESPALSVLTATARGGGAPAASTASLTSRCRIASTPESSTAVLTQYQPRSLNEHIRWAARDLDRTSGGVRLLQPYQSSRGERCAWQEGTADAIRFNLDIVREPVEEVLILAGDHIYKMDYGPMLRFHAERAADVTVAVRTVPSFEAYRYGMVTTDPDNRVVGFEEKPRRTVSNRASMGIYVIRRGILVDWLTGPGKRHRDLGRDVLPAIVNTLRVYAYPFQDYWEDAGTVQAYYEANMALLAETPALDLYDPNWVIHTRSEERPAALLGETARVDGNLLCDGCRVEGTVARSIISPGVYVAPGPPCAIPS